ncbi:MAG: translation initiation factor IF-2 [Clostridia bacterium]|nr:translation initiation factor IF-2 [Clostridia bacterium]
MPNNQGNIEKLKANFSGEQIDRVSKRLSGADRRIADIIRALTDIENAQAEKKQEEERRRAAEEAAAAASQVEVLVKPAAPAESEADTPEKTEAEADNGEERDKTRENPEPVPAEKTEKIAETVENSRESPVRTDDDIHGEQQKPQGQPQGQKQGQQWQQGQKTQPQGQQKGQQTQQQKPQNAQGQQQSQKQGQKPQGQQILQGQQKVQQGQKIWQGQPQGRDRQQGGPQSQGRSGVGAGGQPRQQQQSRGQGQPQKGQQGQKGGGFAAPAQPASKGGKGQQGGKKKEVYYDKGDGNRGTTNKRALARQQGATVDDFDENKSGYRKLRKKGKKAVETKIKIDRAVVTSDEIPLKTLSEKLGISAVDITKKLFREGIMKTVNESIDYDTAALIAADLGIELEYRPEKSAEEKLMETQADTVEEIDKLVSRAPVVTVMGHVDHGKTSLLDRIRSTNVTAGEAGGITQHIGAYSVEVNGKSITFIDTPGHEAFTAMRARGAQVTDIVILVVAADDGVMPQTVEAINHAKAANVPIVVAINKIDKNNAQPDKVKQDLTNHGLVPEEWGGDTEFCNISCKTGEGIQELLETVILVAEMRELLANPEREASGTVIEAQLDKGRGPVATVLVQNGTLHTGDNFISGMATGKVRAMLDDKGRNIKSAGPSSAVYVLGFDEVPNAGEKFYAVTPQLMKQVMEERKRTESDERAKSRTSVSLDELFGKIAEGNLKTLNLIIKADVQGSAEAICHSVGKLANEEVSVKIIHSGAGAINETDVMLAESSSAIIIGFNVRPDPKAKAHADSSGVEIKTYRVIYDIIDDIEAALKGMLTPKFRDVYLGKCEVRQTFRITGVGNIAGCYVLDGKIARGGKLMIYRDDVLVVEGNVQQLKRFKDDVREVAAGYECGCAIEGFNDVKVGDVIECYTVEQIPV